jgi:hypothetical protein
MTVAFGLVHPPVSAGVGTDYRIFQIIGFGGHHFVEIGNKIDAESEARL